MSNEGIMSKELQETAESAAGFERVSRKFHAGSERYSYRDMQIMFAQIDGLRTVMNGQAVMIEELQSADMERRLAE